MILDLLIRAGYDTTKTHPECYRNFSYVFFSELLIESQDLGRDDLAARALNGMLAHATRYKPRHIDIALPWHDAIAKEAYEIADAMLRAGALSRPQQTSEAK